MKRLLIVLLALFLSLNTLAHKVRSGTCPNAQIIETEYGALESLSLLKQLHYLGNRTELPQQSWKSFTEALRVHKVDIKDISIKVHHSCDVLFPSSPSKNFKSVSLTLEAWPYTFFENQSQTSQAAIIKYHIRVTAPSSCLSVLSCKQGILDFRASGMTIDWSYPTTVGGLSSAGGGKKPSSSLFQQDLQMEFQDTDYLIPGFYELLLSAKGDISPVRYE